MCFQSIPKGTKSSRHRDENLSTDEEGGSDNEMVNDSENEVDDQTETGGGEIDDEEDWIKFQEEAKKDNLLETKSKETFPVHCPYYPGVCILIEEVIATAFAKKVDSHYFCVWTRRNWNQLEFTREAFTWELYNIWDMYSNYWRHRVNCVEYR